MNPNKKQAYLGAWRVGRVLLKGSLEAFSGNALYCGRGMPTMNKYKTVKEVCELTGLSRKHLYYFHHEKVVQAVAYANYSVSGYDGYKLYDEAAVERLQQIALYYQLGLKRNEIRDIVLDPKYDSNLVIEKLLALEHTKKATSERHIAALEYLKLSGTKDCQASPLHGISLEELGETIINIQDTVKADRFVAILDEIQAETFFKKFSQQLHELQTLGPSAFEGESGDRILKEMFASGTSCMGEDGRFFILGLFVSAIGDGTVYRELHDIISPALGKAIVHYLSKHPELYKNSPCGTIIEGLKK